MSVHSFRQPLAVAIGIAALSLGGARPVSSQSTTTVRIAAGTLQGLPVSSSGVRTFLGIPFAQAPTGERRWREPQPVEPWPGVREATAFGPRCMQAPIYSDMIFRDQVSEDCLYLNVWTPARRAAQKLPVMVWIYGGGFQAGSASEPRQDGARLATNGVVVVSLNYRLGVFGFLAHPELTAESKRGTSGNYALLDQLAALRWVHDNVAAFGGDPANVTIFGESAGSFSVSALVASPLAKGIVHKAIGESGAFFGATLGAPTLAVAEKAGAAFGADIGATSIVALRAISADSILKASRAKPGRSFSAIIDGVVLPKPVRDIYAAGEQQRIPLLAGWNSDEMRSAVTLNPTPTTAASFTTSVRTRFGPRADEMLAAYPATNDSVATESSAALTSDQFISYGTWKWIETHRATSGKPVYRYLFARQIPIAPTTLPNGRTLSARDVGARHAGEIEYVFGALESVPKVTWEPADHALSSQMLRYWSNFARTGNPNGKGLPLWPAYEAAKGNPVMTLDVTSKAAPEQHRARYEALDRPIR